MKIGAYLLSGLLFSVFCGGSSCHNSQEKSAEAGSQTALFACMDSVTMERNGMKLTRVTDNAKERKMPLSLFGAVPEPLADSLNIKDGIPSSINAFLLETGDKRILFDTGMGSSDSRLMPGLSAAGVSPEDIDYIYLTHFHGDHIGGMLDGDRPVFPRAEVYASRKEYDAWMSFPEEQRQQVFKTFRAYQERMHLFSCGDTLPGGVVAMNGEGHTPGHTVYRAGDFLVIGDLIHGAALQLVSPDYCASYDMTPPVAIRTRKYYLDYARRQGLLMAGMHQPVRSR